MAPSLVRRLVLLAAAWSLVVLVVAGLSLSLFFSHTATTRFDDELGETVDGLLAGTSTEGGQVTPPAAVDPREQRAYSGEYWEIATPDGASGLKALARSRSLWDRALPPPPQGVAALAKPEGQSIFYDAPGPLDQPLRVDALQARVEGYARPVVFMAAEDRTPVNRDVRTFVTTIAVALGILGI
ncbi:MAG TPA: sensor histidine kinase N-terminal domain-containing protein, partial [Caulobacteraceae bacterium]